MNGRILYKDICEDIINKIRSGKFKDGESLPTQQQMCDEYATSLITVKKAVELAEKRGFLVRYRGKKAVVSYGEYVGEKGSVINVVFLDISDPIAEKPAKNQPPFQEMNPIFTKKGTDILKQHISDILSRSANITYATYSKSQILKYFDSTVLSTADKIVIFCGLDGEIASFLNSKKKKFLFYGSQNIENATVIKNNDRSISSKAVKYLISLGHKRIAFIGSADRNGDFSECYKGYQDAMASASLPLATYLIRVCREPQVEEGYRAMSDILYSSIMYGIPTAVFCADDLLAYGALQSIEENQLSCPEDISLLGVNNYTKLCESMTPPLSSIDKKFRSIAERIVKILKSDRWAEEKIIINCDLVIRDSIQEVKKEN